MNNANIFDQNLIILKTLEESLVLVQESLKAFANNPDFAKKMAVAFGDHTEVDALRTAWLNVNFSTFPLVEVISADILGNASGAYASSL
jgi:hypothetical protein